MCQNAVTACQYPRVALPIGSGNRLIDGDGQEPVVDIDDIAGVAVGALILAAPHAFYASYGIARANDPSMLSELRAPAANLAALAVIILAGIVRPALARASMVIALTVFIAFPAGRLMGLAVDGLPSGSILGAPAIEVAIGALCLAAFWRRPVRDIFGQTSVGLQG